MEHAMRKGKGIHGEAQQQIRLTVCNTMAVLTALYKMTRVPCSSV